MALLALAPPVHALAPVPEPTPGLAMDPAATGRVAIDAEQIRPDWGSTKGKGGVLRRGCHQYTYTYDIFPPEGDWGLELFISGPGRNHLASAAYLKGFDPEHGSGTYKLCRVSTRPGRFTIRAKLSAENGPQGYVEGWLPPSHFRLRDVRR